MKTTHNLVLGLLLVLGAAAHAAPQEVLTVAVFDFDLKDEGARDLGPKVATLLSANLSVEPELITVERAELEKVLGEQELGLSGTVSPDTMAKVGHLTGAKVLVTGRVFKLGNQLVLLAKIIGTETSRVYGETVAGAVGGDLIAQTAELAKKVAATVKEKGDTLVARVEPPAERVARIKKSLAGKHLPTVSVKIPEQHFGRPIIDPAAETEISLVLQQVGFTIVDEKSPQKADVEITGEAISELGLRKGSLISCKGRVEIKALQPQRRRARGGPPDRRGRGHHRTNRRQDRPPNRRCESGRAPRGKNREVM